MFLFSCTANGEAKNKNLWSNVKLHINQIIDGDCSILGSVLETWLNVSYAAPEKAEFFLIKTTRLRFIGRCFTSWKCNTIACFWNIFEQFGAYDYTCGEQGWRSGESARLPAMCPGFDSRTRRHKWAEFVGSLLCSERFFSGYSGFPLSAKTNIWFDMRIVKIYKFDLRIVRRTWKLTLNLRGINKYYYYLIALENQNVENSFPSFKNGQRFL